MVCNYGGFYACYVIPCIEKHRHDHRTTSIIGRTGRLITRKCGRVALLKRGIGSCNGSLRPHMDFTRLLGVVGSVSNSFEVEFVADRPGSYAGRLLRAVTSYSGITGRLRLPFRDNGGHILRTVGEDCAERGCLRLVSCTGQLVNSRLSVASSVVINFPNRACRRFYSAISLVGRIGFASLFAFVCSPHRNAPTTGLSSPISTTRGNG